MNKQHTPGPWVAWRDGAVGPTSKEEDQSFGMLLPVAYVEDSDCPESIFANARLIAAAPELLEALEKCRKELSAWMRCYCEDAATQEAISQASAAIAKATGEKA